MKTHGCLFTLFFCFALLANAAFVSAAKGCGDCCKCKKLGGALKKVRGSIDTCIKKCMKKRKQRRYNLDFLNTRNEKGNKSRCTMFCRRARTAREKGTKRPILSFCSRWGDCAPPYPTQSPTISPYPTATPQPTPQPQPPFTFPPFAGFPEPTVPENCLNDPSFLDEDDDCPPAYKPSRSPTKRPTTPTISPYPTAAPQPTPPPIFTLPPVTRIRPTPGPYNCCPGGCLDDDCR